ncbi:MAG TPA: hypothetical protein VGM89_13565 [Puia sp.]|jgi:hypothetical protein
MNKLIGTLLAGLFVVAQQGVQAQVSDHASLMNVHALGVEPAAVKASRDFIQRAGDTKDEQWYKATVGYEAEYTDGPVKALYRYDKKGHWMYSILTYGEDRLPEDVRTLMKSNFYDFNINWVKEVNELQEVVYVVHMENARTWKEVAVQGGEMRVLKEFCK